MGLIIGYNPPSVGSNSKDSAWLKYKAGVANTLYNAAAEVMISTGGGASNKVFYGWVLPRSICPRSGFRFSADLKGGTPGDTLNIYTLFSNLPLPTRGNGYGAASGLPILSGDPSMYCPAAKLVYTTTLSYVNQSFDFSWAPGYNTCLIIAGINAASHDIYFQNVLLRADPDTAEPAQAVSTIFEGVI